MSARGKVGCLSGQIYGYCNKIYESLYGINVESAEGITVAAAQIMSAAAAFVWLKRRSFPVSNFIFLSIFSRRYPIHIFEGT